MELQFTHWLGLMIIIILFGMWVYTLRSDNERFKAIIDKHIARDTSVPDEKPKRKFDPQEVE